MKKIISIFLCVLMFASTVVSASALTGNSNNFGVLTDDGYTVGDVNGDTYVDMKDSLALRKHCAGVEDVDGKAGDINADGTVNAKDLLIIKKCNAGVDDIENYESAAAVDNFLIAGNDISTYSIVYHDDMQYVENAYYAADTLRKYVRVATNVNLSIGTEQTAEHKIEFVDVNTVEGMADKLGIENYVYEVKDGDLYIYGTRRGNMYAVYEILEEVLGYVFYSGEYVYLYNERIVEMEEGTYVFHDSGLDFRFTGQSMDNYKTEFYFPRRMNGTQIYSHADETYGTLTGPIIINAHSYGYYWRMATGEVDVEFNGTNNNDYYAKYQAGIQKNELQWNPCSTDDVTYATLFRGLLETLRYVQGWNTFREETSSMSFSICDNAKYFCSCVNCKYIYAEGEDRDRGTRLDAGGAGLNIYLANRACRDIREFYESYDEDGFYTGRPAGIEEKDEIAADDWYSYGYGEAIKDVYPDLKLFTIIYDHTPPSENLFTDERYADLIPEDNLIIMFCGSACNNHYMGSGECGDTLNTIGNSGTLSSEGMKGWGDACARSGAEMWFWYYAVSYNCYLSDSPNILNIYYDFKYAVEECHVNGIFYEGGSGGYIFENLKAYLASVVMWEIEADENGDLMFMSYDEFIDVMQEYLMIYYGAGWEYVYEYILMQDEASSENPCYVNNLDYPGDMFGYEYIGENYEYMRELVLKAMAAAETEDEKQHCEYLLMNIEFLGLSALHKSWYTSEEATEEHKALYEERYTWLYNYIKNNNIDLWVYDIDDIELDMSLNPMKLFYDGGSWKPEYADTWTWTGSIPEWGYHG